MQFTHPDTAVERQLPVRPRSVICHQIRQQGSLRPEGMGTRTRAVRPAKLLWVATVLRPCRPAACHQTDLQPQRTRTAHADAMQAHA